MENLADEFSLPINEIASRLDEAGQRLLETRASRIRPATDDKIIAGWNGLVLTLLAEAGRFLDRDPYLPAAQQLANFVVSEMLDEGRLHRSWRQGRADHPGMLEDYGAIANGLIDLYQVDFDPTWIDTAAVLLSTVQKHFEDPQGGFFDSPVDQTDLITRPKSIQDSPTPSGNSLVVRAMLRLGNLTPQSGWQDKAIQAVSSLQTTIEKYPSMFSAWLLNLDWVLGPVLQLAFVGDPQNQRFNQLVAVSDDVFLPRLIRAGGIQTQSSPLTLLENRTMIDDLPTAYLCQDFTCNLPTPEPDELRRQISQATGTETR
jgi:uncharacterized protein YyaL (SSP411 family)